MNSATNSGHIPKTVVITSIIENDVNFKIDCERVRIEESRRRQRWWRQRKRETLVETPFADAHFIIALIDVLRSSHILCAREHMSFEIMLEALNAFGKQINIICLINFISKICVFGNFRVKINVFFDSLFFGRFVKIIIIISVQHVQFVDSIMNAYIWLLFVCQLKCSCCHLKIAEQK